MTGIKKRTAGDLTQYDPQKGLLKISVMEGLEDRFRRAKDADGLMKAIEEKMSEQRNFVVWWDGLGDKRGRPKKTSQISDVLQIADLGIGKDTIHRWRKLKDEEKFEKEVANQQEKAIRRIEYSTTDTIANKHTGEQENYTPEEVIDSVRKVLGTIDLDPASSVFAQKVVKAKKYFTVDDNGLDKPWHGNVFLNPPYQMPEIRDFTDKLIEELPNISSAILLTNNNTDTKWFYKCATNSVAVCFTKGRINFYKVDAEKTYPTNGQAFFYFGDDLDKFKEVFSDIGLVMSVIS